MKGMLCALGASALASAASADTATTTFLVQATVANTCTISATGINFGNYVGSDLDGTATLTATCQNGAAYTVALNAGSTIGSTVTARRMTKTGGALLPYALFRDAGRTQNWGQTIGTDTVAGAGTGSAQTLTVYGRIAAGATAASGGYSDTITATINF
jgi:spore coat protein U-like protein